MSQTKTDVKIATMKEHNKNLASAAKGAGVVNYANFQDARYMGLYGGLRQKYIKTPTAEHVKESRKRVTLATKKQLKK